jgi:hypothetical protein
MKLSIYQLFIFFLILSCSENKTNTIEFRGADQNRIEGSWKLVYAEIRENDSLQIKDFGNTEFIKIINKTHFAFFNQELGTSENFMAGGGTYEFDGINYTETLNFIASPDYRNHIFKFKAEIKGDSLIQQGFEKIEKADLDRYILEKYVRIQKTK